MAVAYPWFMLACNYHHVLTSSIGLQHCLALSRGML